MPLISREIEFNLSCSKHCAFSEILRTDEVPANQAATPHTDLVPPTQTTKATFQINNAKLYVPVPNLSINHTINFLQKKAKQEFKTTIS